MFICVCEGIQFIPGQTKIKEEAAKQTRKLHIDQTYAQNVTVTMMSLLVFSNVLLYLTISLLILKRKLIIFDLTFSWQMY